MSQRYLGLDGWEGLLKRFAALTDKPWDRYFSEAEGDWTVIASDIAEQFAPTWWESDEYAESREENEGRVPRNDTPLKIEIGRYMAHCLDALDESGEYAHELRLLARVQVDGIITTNYDPLLEYLFPDFKAFVGQSELLFSDALGVGEIYKIHGSYEVPASLVLTDRDYQGYDLRNPYLAAKLLTIFVDHPVIFLGYSMSDDNIGKILDSIASALTAEHLEKLQDRLVFIEWDGRTEEASLGHSTYTTAEGARIPVRSAKVLDYTPIYSALGENERNFPARVLRQLKKRVYELVETSDPVGALRVVNLDGDDVAKMDVVFGIGAIARLGALGYLGLVRRDILFDVLDDKEQYDAAVVVETVVPKILHSAPYTPVYKYLRAAEMLDDSGKLRIPKDACDEVRKYVRCKRADFGPPDKFYREKAKESAKKIRTFKKLAKTETPKRVLTFVAALPEDGLDLDAFRDFLIEHGEEFYDAGGSDRTLWSKAVCLYDWERNRST